MLGYQTFENKTRLTQVLFSNSQDLTAWLWTIWNQNSSLNCIWIQMLTVFRRTGCLVLDPHCINYIGVIYLYRPQMNIVETENWREPNCFRRFVKRRFVDWWRHSILKKCFVILMIEISRVFDKWRLVKRHLVWDVSGVWVRPERGPRCGTS